MFSGKNFGYYVAADISLDQEWARERFHLGKSLETRLIGADALRRRVVGHYHSVRRLSVWSGDVITAGEGTRFSVGSTRTHSVSGRATEGLRIETVRHVNERQQRVCPPLSEMIATPEGFERFMRDFTEVVATSTRLAFEGGHLPIPAITLVLAPPAS